MVSIVSAFKKRLQNLDVSLGAAVGIRIRHVLQTIVRADHPKVAPDVTIEVAKENLSANRDAVETGKLFVGHVDAPDTTVPESDVYQA
jgi:hypothetical protein